LTFQEIPGGCDLWACKYEREEPIAWCKLISVTDYSTVSRDLSHLCTRICWRSHWRFCSRIHKHILCS